MPTTPTMLFTYGTMMRNHRNHERLRKGARFMRTTETVDARFRLVAKGCGEDGLEYLAPMAVAGDFRIIGECYWIYDRTLWEALDHFAGAPFMYRRVLVKVIGITNTTYMYAKGTRNAPVNVYDPRRRVMTLDVNPIKYPEPGKTVFHLPVV